MAQFAYPIADLAAGSWQALGPGYETVRNMLTYTEAADNAAWGKFSCSITADAVAAANPAGVLADKIVEDTSGNSHVIARNVTLIAGNTYFLSVYVKSAGRDWLYLELFRLNGGTLAWYDLANGVVGSSNGSANPVITSLGNGEYRCSLSAANISAGGFQPFVQFGPSNADNTGTYTGDGSSGIYAWGMQLEQAASLSAYQPIITTNPPLAVGSVLYSVAADSGTGTPDDSNYIYVMASGSTAKLQIAPVPDPLDGSSHKLHFRGYTPAAGTVQVDLYSGATLIKSTTQLLTASPVTYDMILSAAEADAITNYSDLEVWLASLDNEVRITWIQFEAPRAPLDANPLIFGSAM